MDGNGNKIYWTDAERFEHWVGDLLRRFEFPVKAFDGRAPLDFTIEYERMLVAIEVKYFRTVNAIKSIVNDAAARLSAFVADHRQYQGAILVVSSIVETVHIDALAAKYGVFVADALTLRKWAEDFPDLASQLEQLLPMLRKATAAPIEESPQRQRLAGPLLDNLLSLVTVAVNRPHLPPRTKGRDLCRELHALAKGKATASKFEDLGGRIFEYLFQEGLDWKTHRPQKRSADGLHIFDLVCRVRGGTAFWDFVLNECRTRYMVFELKNYAGKIGQNQVYSTEKYLFKEAFRSVAIIFSRLGPDSNAIEASRGAMRDGEKLLIHVNDTDICKMLELRDNDDDPADYIFALVDAFLMELGR
ncbi:hypothetical protein LL998_21765 [Burkholderia ambifaria]|uniref:hypothetical protein n=1 Tax=Burkholderia ambifaria TaxID=152480 RepID=UPI001E514F90|nr:hypothetical protein [Burkholderia ambifaria]UEP38573.1 hypothetical protein LL998_21765 [Burkholderia ambifaria]